MQGITGSGSTPNSFGSWQPQKDKSSDQDQGIAESGSTPSPFGAWQPQTEKSTDPKQGISGSGSSSSFGAWQPQKDKPSGQNQASTDSTPTSSFGAWQPQKDKSSDQEQDISGVGSTPNSFGSWQPQTQKSTDQKQGISGSSSSSSSGAWQPEKDKPTGQEVSSTDSTPTSSFGAWQPQIDKSSDQEQGISGSGSTPNSFGSWQPESQESTDQKQGISGSSSSSSFGAWQPQKDKSTGQNQASTSSFGAWQPGKEKSSDQEQGSSESSSASRPTSSWGTWRPQEQGSSQSESGPATSWGAWQPQKEGSTEQEKSSFGRGPTSSWGSWNSQTPNPLDGNGDDPYRFDDELDDPKSKSSTNTLASAVEEQAGNSKPTNSSKDRPEWAAIGKENDVSAQPFLSDLGSGVRPSSVAIVDSLAVDSDERNVVIYPWKNQANSLSINTSASSVVEKRTVASRERNFPRKDKLARTAMYNKDCEGSNDLSPPFRRSAGIPSANTRRQSDSDDDSLLQDPVDRPNDRLPDNYDSVLAWAASEPVPPTLNHVVYQLRNHKVLSYAVAGKSRWGLLENLRANYLVSARSSGDKHFVEASSKGKCASGGNENSCVETVSFAFGPTVGT